MKNIVIIQVILIILTKFSPGFAQDTINLLSGRQIIAKVVKTDSSSNNNYISYDIMVKRKLKSKFIEKEDVYSIAYYSSIKEIVYKMDSSKGFILDQDQMYNYMVGEQVAWKKHKTPRLIIAGGVLSGMSGPFLGLYGVIIPLSYTAAISFEKPIIQYDPSKNPTELNKEYYKLGYSGVAKSKNIRSVIIAGISGIVAGAILITAFQIE